MASALSTSRVGMLVMAGFLLLAAVAQLNDPDPVVWIAVYALPSLLTTWACVTITGSRLWRMLCITVLSGVILFACQVVYAAVEGGRFENNIVTSEEGRSLNGPLRFPSVNCNVKGAIIRVLCMFTLSVISHNN